MSNISSIYVPNSGRDGSPIVCIGESPGSDETRLKQPFIGASGTLLRQVLANAGFNVKDSIEVEKHGIKLNDSGDVKFLNLSNYQPAGNKFSFLEDSQELKDGLANVRNYLKNFPPKICILLGEMPLEYILNKYGISNWRGSVIVKDNIHYIPTYHPAYITRSGGDYPIFSFDIQKAYRVYTKSYTFPIFDLKINPYILEVEELIDEYSKASAITVDIETIKNTNTIISIGFGISRSRAFCIANKSTDGLDPEFRRVVESILCDTTREDPILRKRIIFHNGLFDIELLHNNQIDVPIHFDTMVAQHVLQPEFPKGLDFITSIYTDIPYYKDRGRAALPENEKGWGKLSDSDRLNVYEYNCLDVCATFWCYEEMLKEIEADACFKHTFDFEMSLHPLSLHITRSGMPIDLEKRDILHDVVMGKYAKEQAFLEAIVGHEINVNSNPQKQALLYTEWKLPVKNNEKGKVTADEDAIVSLISFTKDYAEKLIHKDKKLEWFKKVAGLQCILKIMGYRKLLGSYIDIDFHPDNRIRSVYKITGTNTGRWSCSKYYDDTGLNAQTMPRESIEV